MDKARKELFDKKAKLQEELNWINIHRNDLADIECHNVYEYHYISGMYNAYDVLIYDINEQLNRINAELLLRAIFGKDYNPENFDEYYRPLKQLNKTRRMYGEPI